MLRMIFWFAVLAALAALAAWLADRPGHIAIEWLGYHIETSLAVAVLAILALLVVLWLVWSLLRRILHTPGAVAGYFRGRRQRRGQQALSRGIVAVAAGDRDAARRQAEIAARLLPGDPLARLLEAQTAQLRGDHRRVERVFADMLADPDTEVVALRGLYARALQAGEEARARELAERAYRRQPGLDWASSAMLKSRAADRDWPAVLAVLEARRRVGLIDENTAKRKRAVVLTAEALEAEKADAAAAIDLAGKALKLDPALVPAAALLARVHFAQGSLKRGRKVIEKTWAIHPHPDLAEAYAHARPGDSAQDRLARIRDLLKVSPGEEEGAVALARAAIEARDWSAARAALAPYAVGRPRARVCVLMAEIDEGELGDKGRAREWLARAVSAPRDPAWVADGFVSDRWYPVSPISGELGVFVWKAPLESLGYTEPTAEPALPLPPVIEAEALPPQSHAAPRRSEAPPTPAVEPKPERKPELKPEASPQPKPELRPEPRPATQAKRDAQPAVPPQPPAAAAAANPGSRAEPAATEVPVPKGSRQPDDPGPEPDGDPARGTSGAWARRLAGT